MNQLTITALLLAVVGVALFTVGASAAETPAEQVYGKLQAIPPSENTMKDLTPELDPDNVDESAWNDYMKSRNSKFLGVEPDSED